VCVYVLLRSDLRTLHLLGKNLSHSPSPFFFSYFSDKVILLPRLVWDLDPPTYALLVAGITGVYHHGWLSVNFLMKCFQEILKTTGQLFYKM
jgi:hypothetical protein